MKYEDILKYEGKKVIVLLKNNYRYKGTVIKVISDSIILNDKYGQDVLISFDTISTLSEYLGFEDK